MSITQKDAMLVFTMALAVVVMSFLFPAFGIGGDEVTENEIPELNISENRFNLAGESPEFPNSPKEGRLWFNTTKDLAFSENSIWLTGDTSGGVELTLIQNASNPNVSEVIISRWNGSLAEQDRAFLAENETGATQRDVISVQGWRLAVEVGDDNAPPEYLEIDWNVAEGSESTGFIGTVFGAVSQTASVLAWLVIVFIWFSTAVVQFFLNAMVLIFEVSSYFIALLLWLLTTYGSIITAAPSWTKVFVALPGIILSVTLGKIVVVFIGLIPTT